MQKIYQEYCDFPGKKREIGQIDDLVKIEYCIKLTESPFCLLSFHQRVELITLIHIILCSHF